MVLAGVGVARWLADEKNKRRSCRWRQQVLGACLLANVGAAWYFSTVHQSGPIATTRFLASRLTQEPPQQHGLDVLFLMPCHATPAHSYLHVGPRCARLRFLDCSPQIAAVHPHVRYSRMSTESAYFERQPLPAARQLFQQEQWLLPQKAPRRVVLFDDHWDALKTFLANQSYVEVRSTGMYC